MRRIIIALLFLFVLFVTPVRAADEYTGSVTYNIKIKPDLTVSVDQILDIKNNSHQYIVNFIELLIPFDVASINVVSDGHNVPFTKEDNRIRVDLKNIPVGLESQRKVIISYQLKQKVGEFGNMHNFYWPLFNYEFNVASHIVNIAYPQYWGDISYASADIEAETSNAEYRQVTFRTDKGILINTGSYTNVRINANWSATNTKAETVNIKVPVPQTPVSEFSMSQVSGAENGEIHHGGSFYLTTKIASGSRHDLSYSGVLSKKEPQLAERTTLSNFYADISFLKIPSGEQGEILYQDILRRLKPANQFDFQPRLGIKDTILKPEHSSLDYSSIVTAAFREKGIPAEVVYGLVYYPIINQLHWHYWVMINENGSWRQIDPFLEDLLGFDFYHKLNPERFIWGVLDDSSDSATDNLSGFDLNRIIDFRVEDVKGIVSVNTLNARLILKGTAYSAQPLPLYAELKNEGSLPLLIRSIQVEGIDIQSDYFDDIWLIPGATAEVFLPGVSVDDPFFTGSKVITGTIAHSIGEQYFEQPLSTDVNLKIDYRALTINLSIIFMVIALFSIYFRTKLLNKFLYVVKRIKLKR